MTPGTVVTATEYPRALLDTSVVIDLAEIDEELLPLEGAISSITLAELSAGVSHAPDPFTRAVRLRALQAVEATFDVLPFDPDAARTYGQVDALIRVAGRKPRGRFADLLIAATAISQDLPLLTRNPKDLVGLESILTSVSI